MALPGVVIKIAGDAKNAVTSIDNVGEALKRLPGDAAKAAQGVGTHASNLSRAVRKTSDDAETDSKKVGKSFSGMEDSAIGAATGIGEAFSSGGGIASGIGGLGEVVESFAGSFGPLGLAVGAAGGVILGAVSSFVGNANKKFEELKAKAGEVYESLIEGQGNLDAAYKKAAVEDFIKDNYKLVDALRAVAGPKGLMNLRESLGGSRDAQYALNQQIADGIGKLEKEQAPLQRKLDNGIALTEAERKQYEQNKDRLKQLGDLTKKTNDNADAVGLAKDEYDLLTDTMKATKDQTKTFTEMNDRANDSLYGTQDAAKKARTAMEHLWESAPKDAAAWDPINQRWLDKFGKPIKTGRQQGGQVTAGEPYMVGESGPETFVPSSNGYIMPTGGGWVATGGSTAPLTVHVHLHAAVTTPQVVREAAPTITRAVVDAARRSGMRVPAGVYTDMGRP